MPKQDLQVLDKLVHTDNMCFNVNPIVLFAHTANCHPALNTKAIPVSTKRDQGNNREDGMKKLSFAEQGRYKPEDSGYLSSDSNDPPKLNIKSSSSVQLNITNGEGGSETDESFGDGQSESGAESVETHSVFFDIFRKAHNSQDQKQNTEVTMGSSSVTISEREGFICNNYSDMDSDSETVSYTTVVPLSSNVSTISSNDVLTA